MLPLQICPALTTSSIGSCAKRKWQSSTPWSCGSWPPFVAKETLQCLASCTDWPGASPRRLCANSSNRRRPLKPLALWNVYPYATRGISRNPSTPCGTDTPMLLQNLLSGARLFRTSCNEKCCRAPRSKLSRSGSSLQLSPKSKKSMKFESFLKQNNAYDRPSPPAVFWNVMYTAMVHVELQRVGKLPFCD